MTKLQAVMIEIVDATTTGIVDAIMIETAGATTTGIVLTVHVMATVSIVR